MEKKGAIVVLDSDPFSSEQIESAFGPFGREVVSYKFTPPELVVERCDGAAYVHANKTRVEGDVMREVLRRNPDTCFISDATGYDEFDIKLATAAGRPVYNCGQYAGDSVADLAMWMIIDQARGFSWISRAIAEGAYNSQSRPFYFNAEQYRPGFVPLELRGQVLGLIGAGDIGNRVATRAKAHGMDVIVYDPYRSNSDLNYVTKHTLLTEAKFVSLHMPFKGKRVITNHAISMMQDGACIINTARQRLVDEAAIARGIRIGKLRSYGRDAYGTEPMFGMADCDPLFGLDGLIDTGHRGFLTCQSAERLLTAMVVRTQYAIDGQFSQSINITAGELRNVARLAGRSGKQTRVIA